jgi:hypothetical protein
VGVTCSTHGDDKNAYKNTSRKFEGMIQLVKPRHMCEHNINMNFKRCGLGECGLDSTGSA